MSRQFTVSALILFTALCFSAGPATAQPSGWIDKGNYKELNAHQGAIFSAAYIDSGKKIITTSGSEYKIWDTKSGFLVKEHKYPTQKFAFMNITDDTTAVVSYEMSNMPAAYYNGDTVNVEIYDLNQDSLIYNFTITSIHTEYYTNHIYLYYSHSNFNRNENTLYYSLFYYRMWGTSTIYAKHFGNLYKIKLLKDSAYMESLSELPLRDFQICNNNQIIALADIFEVSGSSHGGGSHSSFDYLLSGQNNLLSPVQIHKIDNDKEDPLSIRTFRVLQKKNRIAELLSDSRVLWWDLNTLKLVGGSKFPHPPLDFHFSLSENRIIAGARDGFYIFSTPSMTVLDSMPFPLGDYAWKIAVAPDSVSFAAGSSDGYLRLFKSNAIFGPDETVDIPGTTSRDSQMLFPNPASDFINLPGLADAVDEVSLYSAIGCKVYSGKPDGGRLNVSFLPPGIYFLEQGRKYYKFIKV